MIEFTNKLNSYVRYDGLFLFVGNVLGVPNRLDVRELDFRKLNHRMKLERLSNDEYGKYFRLINNPCLEFDYRIKTPVYEELITPSSEISEVDGYSECFFKIGFFRPEKIERSPELATQAVNADLLWNEVFLNRENLKEFEQRYGIFDHGLILNDLRKHPLKKEIPNKSDSAASAALKVIGLFMQYLAENEEYQNQQGAPNKSKIKDFLLELADDQNISRHGLNSADDGILTDALNYLAEQKAK